ncbi:amidohydrolase family protein [Novosphingobium sp. RL4]|uniref:amidohydrolase family protein n=1 Tax=Novosphingobium sp. RL4 TaxID=3109595 RepID=UPI002D7966FB|nr:amidohydrolase family protein [Novosphingobium sp. RL4]WRT91729.1 amidohydrolase family protein [Novosphingobium sp. RL4]
MSEATMTAPYSGPLFDVQAHAVMPKSVAMMSAAIRSGSFLSEDTKRIIIEDIFAKAADDLQSDFRREAAGTEGIQVVTVNMAFPELPPEQLIDIFEATNKWMAEKVAGQRHLIGTAVLPPVPALAAAGSAPDGNTWLEKALLSLRIAIEEQGLRGIMASSHYDGTFLGASMFEPFFGLAEELRAPFIIHPAVTSAETALVPRKLIPIDSGYLNDQRTALLDIVKAGILERHPDLTIIATHLGGGILTSLGRFDQLANRFPDEHWYMDAEGHRSELREPVSSYLKRIYYDCNNAEKADILHAASMVGIDHLLTGTDFPWATDVFTRKVLGSLEPLTAQKIAFENASKLFRR